MKRVLIYGAGNNCIYSMNEIVKRFDVVGICDGSESKQGTPLFGHVVGAVTDHTADSYDLVVVTPSYTESIKQSLTDAGIDEEKIIMLEDALPQPACYGDFVHSSDKSVASYGDGNDTVGCNIAIIFYGGLGDYIIGKNWLYHLAKQIDLTEIKVNAYFSENMLGNARSVFNDSDLISRINAVDTSLPELVDVNLYDLVLSYSIFPMVRYIKAEHIIRKAPELYSYASRLREFGNENYNTGFFASPDFYRTVSALFKKFPDKKYHELYDVLDDMRDTCTYYCNYSLEIDEEEYLAGLGLKKDRFITINTGANEEYTRKPSTRTWQHDNWLSLIRLLKEKGLSDIKIVRMGLADPGGNDTDADIDLCGKTSVEQAKALLKSALVHIDYEGGLVHLRHVLCGKPSVVLHGPTSVERYGYPENTAIRSDKCPKACEWSSRDWLTVCHYEKDSHVCMRSITPEYVLERIMDVIEKEDGK